MKRFMQYIYLEWKRMLTSLPGICLASLCIVFFVAGIFCICHLGNNQQEQQLVHIGVVADKDEPFLDWMISMLSKMEKTKDKLRFKKLEEAEADKQLSERKINVIILIPHHYIYSIIKGTNKHLTIRFAKGETSIISLLLSQLSETASSLILNSEAGIYALQEYYQKYGYTNMKKDELALNLLYLQEAAKLDRGIKIEEIQTQASYPLISSYVVSAIILLLFLWGLTYSKMLTSQTRAFQNQLRLFGLGIEKQLLARGIAFYGINLINYAILVCLAGVAMIVSNIWLPDTLLKNPGGLLLFAIALLPALLLTTAFIQFVYEMTEDALGGILFLFFSVMIMGFFSGCFYPMDLLPKMVQNIGKLTPIYQLRQYGLSLLHHASPIKPLFGILLYSIGCYAFILLIRHIRRTQEA